MGLRRLFKGIGKIIKKIGRGIKRVVKKVGKFVGKIMKPFQKLGIVGQIALMILLPYAGSWIWKGLLKMAPGVLAAAPVAGAVGTAATSVGITAGTEFGLAGLKALGTAMTSPSANIFQKIIGRTVQAIHAGGKAFQTITGFISEGVDKVVDWGRKMFGSDTGLITNGVDNIKLSSINPNTKVVTTNTWGELKAAGEHLKGWAWDSDAGKFIETYKTEFKFISEDVAGNIFGSTEVLKDQATEVLKEKIEVSLLASDPTISSLGTEASQMGLPEELTPIIVNQPTYKVSAADPSFGKKVATGISSGVIQGVTEGVQIATTNYLAGDEYGGSSYTEIVQPLTQTTYTKFNEVDLMAQNRGYYYGGTAHQANMNEMWEDPYWKTMQGLS